MTELEHLMADLRVQEARYAAAKVLLHGHGEAKAEAEEMARLQNLLGLCEVQAKQEAGRDKII